MAYQMTLAHRKKISAALRGRTPKNLTLLHTAEIVRKRSITMSGNGHPRWRGGKPSCTSCGKKLGNYGGKYCVRHRIISAAGLRNRARGIREAYKRHNWAIG